MAKIIVMPRRWRPPTPEETERLRAFAIKSQDNPSGRRESGHWRPYRWSPDKIRRYVRHVFRHVNNALGPYAGALIEHEIRTRIAELESVEEFRRIGVETIGDRTGAVA